MKLYQSPPPPTLIRVNIKRQGNETQFITLCECTQEEALEFVKTAITKQNLSPFQSGNVTNVEIRVGEGSVNGKSVSVSFRGLSPRETQAILLSELELLNNK